MHEDPPVPLLAGDTTTALVPTPPHHAFRHVPPPSLACTEDRKRVQRFPLRLNACTVREESHPPNGEL
jgi:hypothetical protein